MPDPMRRSTLLFGVAVLIAALLVWLVIEASGSSEVAPAGAAPTPAGTETPASPAADAVTPPSIRTAVAERQAPSPVARMLAVTTVDSMGGAVSDVTIAVGDPRGGTTDSALGITDAQGRLAIDFARLRFGPQGFARLTFQHHTLSAQAAYVTRYFRELRVTLEPGGRLVVRVLDRSDQPVAKARIEQLRETDRGYDQLVTATWQTDTEGIATIRGIQHELLHLRVRAEGFAQKEVETPVQPKVDAEMVVRLDPGAQLLLSVVGPAGVAVAHADVVVFDPQRRWGGFEWKDRSDKDGVATFTSLPRSLKSIDVNVTHLRFEKLEQRVALHDRKATRAELRLRPADVIRVRVTDKNGQAPAGWVSARDPDIMTERYRQSVRIDKDGVAVLGGIPKGLAVVLSVYQGHIVTAVRTGVRAGPSGEREIEIRVPATIEVGFELVDAAERRVAGSVSLESAEGRKAPHVTPFGKARQIELRYTANTELRKTQQIPVRPGRYRVRVWLDTGLWRERPELALIQPGTVRLSIGDTKTLGGTLFDGNGRPLSGQIIQLWSRRGIPLTTTNANGKFRFENLEGGIRSLAILDPIIGAVMLRSQVSPGPDLHLVYRRLPLRGRVHGFDHAAPRATRIQVIETSGVAAQGMLRTRDPRVYRPPLTDDQGRFQLSLPEGTYELRASIEDLVSLPVSVVFRAGNTTPSVVELVVYRPGWLRLGAKAVRGQATRLVVRVQGEREHWRHEYQLSKVGRERATWRAAVPAGDVVFQLFDAGGKLLHQGKTTLAAGEQISLLR